jgi:hypothetical protein
MREQTSSILSEHEAPDQNIQGATQQGYQPTPEEESALKLANSLYEKNKKYRKQYDKDWLDNYKFFRGKQWKEQRPSYRHSEVVNMVFSAIQSTVPIQLDSRPRLEYLPQNPKNVEFAEIINQVAESDWIKHNWLMEVAEILYDSNFYGAGLGCMEFDPDADYGIGAIDFHSADPMYCFPDTRAKNVNKKARNFIYAEPEEVEVLKGKYPEKAAFFKPDLQDLLQGNKQDLDQVRFKSPLDTKVTIEGSSAYEIGDVAKCLKITAYIKSNEYIEEEKDGPVNPDTGVKEKLYQQKKKYPNGRKIVIAGGVVCEDGPIPYDDGLFPYARYLNYILPREFWGMSEIEQLKGPQKIFNKLLSFALDIYTLMGNPIWVVESTSGLDTDNVFNVPGGILEIEPGTNVRREGGVDVSPTLLSLVDRLRNWFNETSGATDVSRGVEPQDITAGVAIQALQEAAQTRVRQKSRNLDAFLQDLGALYLSRVFQFYSSPRIVRVTQNENAHKYFRFHVETQLDADGNAILNDAGDPVRVAKVTPYDHNPDTNQHTELGTKEYLIEGGFDVRVSTGSSLPFAKVEKTNLAVTLFKLNAIDRTELLKSVEYPNWETVAQRMDQLDQQKEQAMAQAKAGGH